MPQRVRKLNAQRNPLLSQRFEQYVADVIEAVQRQEGTEQHQQPDRCGFMIIETQHTRPQQQKTAAAQQSDPKRRCQCLFNQGAHTVFFVLRVGLRQAWQHQCADGGGQCRWEHQQGHDEP